MKKVDRNYIKLFAYKLDFLQCEFEVEEYSLEVPVSIFR